MDNQVRHLQPISLYNLITCEELHSYEDTTRALLSEAKLRRRSHAIGGSCGAMIRRTVYKMTPDY